MSDKDKDFAGKARAAAAEFSETARERVEDAFGAAVVGAENGLDEAHAFIKRQLRDRPLTVAGAALGLGVLIGLALSPRSRH